MEIYSLLSDDFSHRDKKLELSDKDIADIVITGDTFEEGAKEYGQNSDR